MPDKVKGEWDYRGFGVSSCAACGLAEGMALVQGLGIKAEGLVFHGAEGFRIQGSCV